MFTDAIRIVLGSQEGVEVVGQAQSVSQAIEAAKENHPDVIILNSDLPNDGKAHPAQILAESLPNARILVLCGVLDTDLLAEVIEGGAAGYMTKDSPLTELVQATLTVAKGEVVIPQGMLGALLSRLVRRRRAEQDALLRHSLLTRREREVLALLAGGANNEDIAKELVISPQTARTHVQNVLSKLGVHSRLQAASLAIRTGLLNNMNHTVREIG